jgi:hypothetical protein
MSKPVMTHDQFLHELNARLRAHPQYELGMSFKAAPDAATGANIGGFLWEAPPDKENLMRAIERGLAQEVELRTA